MQHIIDEDGDLVLKLKQENSERQIRVSSHILCRASMFFKNALKTHFSEGTLFDVAKKMDIDSELSISDDDPDRLIELLELLHHPFEEKQTSIQSLYELTLLSDKYACVKAVRQLAMQSTELQTTISSVATMEPGTHVGHAEDSSLTTIQKLLKVLSILGMPEQFHLLFEYLVLQYKGSLIELRTPSVSSVHDEVLAKTVNSIEDQRFNSRQRLKEELDDLVKETVKMGYKDREQYENAALVYENLQGQHNRVTIETSGCVIFSTKLKTMLEQLVEQVDWPDMFQANMPHEDDTLQTTLDRIDRIMKDFDEFRESVNTNPSAALPVFPRSHTESCPTCVFKLTPTWWDKKEKVLDMTEVPKLQSRLR